MRNDPLPCLTLDMVLILTVRTIQLVLVCKSVSRNGAIIVVQEIRYVSNKIDK